MPLVIIIKIKIRIKIRIIIILDECTTLWGEPERGYVQNVEQLHVSSEIM